MRALMVVKHGALAWRESAEPALRGDVDAIVRPFVAARCDGDPVFLRHDLERAMTLGARLHVLDDSFSSRDTNPFAAPFAYGHECVAEITAIGKDVKHLSVGDRVVVPWSISCGTCRACNAGLTSKCETARGDKPLAAYGFGRAIGGHGGMMSDAVRVPFADAMLVRVPRGVDPVAIASASDNLCDAHRSVAPYLKNDPEAAVLVIGGGAKSIGLYAAGIAKALGSRRVDYFDASKTRRAIAERLGARAIERITERYPITVDASSTSAGLARAIEALSPGGTCTGVGFYVRRGTPVPLWKMYMTSATLRVGVSHARADLPSVLALVADEKFDPSIVTTLVADWNDAPRAMFERTTKVVVRRAPLQS
jgi:alcohol dehydrogenase